MALSVRRTVTGAAGPEAGAGPRPPVYPGTQHSCKHNQEMRPANRDSEVSLFSLPAPHESFCEFFHHGSE